MAGMPVPQLSAPAPAQQSNENATAYRDAPLPSAKRETFAVGDDEGDEDDGGDIQIADVRGRNDTGTGEGGIQL
jgi:hypothetical protein